jgi:hypothetical protein
MAGRRRNKKPGPADNAAPGLDVAAWARRILEEAGKTMPDDELALLQAQVRTLAQAEAAPAPLPPDPTAPNIIRDRKSLKQVAARLEGASEVVIDLETSSLDPFAGEVVGVGLSAADVNYYIPKRLLELDRKLPAILRREAQPADAREGLALAQLCRQYKRLYATSARLYADAFAADPRLADDLRAPHLYAAARAAALAAAGKGEDAAKLEDAERARLRGLALAWLWTDLRAWGGTG